MAHSLSFLRSSEAAEGRKARGAKWIVWAEVKSFCHFELDADDADHAQRLARHWVSTMGAMSSSFQRVFADGSLGGAVAIFSGHDDTDFEEVA